MPSFIDARQTPLVDARGFNLVPKVGVDNAFAQGISQMMQNKRYAQARDDQMAASQAAAQAAQDNALRKRGWAIEDAMRDRGFANEDTLFAEQSKISAEQRKLDIANEKKELRRRAGIFSPIANAITGVDSKANNIVDIAASLNLAYEQEENPQFKEQLGSVISDFAKDPNGTKLKIQGMLRGGGFGDMFSESGSGTGGTKIGATGTHREKFTGKYDSEGRPLYQHVATIFPVTGGQLDPQETNIGEPALKGQTGALDYVREQASNKAFGGVEGKTEANTLYKEAIKAFENDISRAKTLGAKMAAYEAEAIVKRAEIAANIPVLGEKMENMKKLANKASYTFVGKAFNSMLRQAGADVPEGAVARVAMQSYVKMEIYPQLKAIFGAQMAAVEGERLVSAMVDPDASAEEKKKSLNTYFDSVKSQYRKLNNKAKLLAKDGGWTPEEKEEYFWAIGIPEDDPKYAKIAQDTLKRLTDFGGKPTKKGAKKAAKTETKEAAPKYQIGVSTATNAEGVTLLFTEEGWVPQ